MFVAASFVEEVDHVFVKGFGATDQHNALHFVGLCKKTSHLSLNQLCINPSVMDLVSVRHLPGRFCKRCRGAPAQGIGDIEIPVCPEIVQVRLGQDVLLCPAGIQAVDGRVLVLVFHDGSGQLHHGGDACATGKHANVTELQRGGDKFDCAGLEE